MSADLQIQQTTNPASWQCSFTSPAPPAGFECDNKTLVLPPFVSSIVNSNAVMYASAGGTANVCARVIHAADANPINDFACAQVRAVALRTPLLTPIDATATTIPVADIRLLPKTGVIEIDGERMSYNGTAPAGGAGAGIGDGPRPGFLLNVLRGVDGTTPSFHEVGAEVLLVTPSCDGDCGGENQVTTQDVLQMVTIALDEANANTCAAGDTSHDGVITVDEIVGAVIRKQDGCP